MTGLDPSSDTILSISCVLTNASLSPLDSKGYDAVIHHTSDQLDNMSEWCIQTHGNSGLTEQCLSSSTTAETAAKELLAYIKHHIPEPRRALLAGNSIHADKSFLMLPPWNVILEHLHYRLFDVSATKEMIRRWSPDQILASAPRKELKHTAHDDVLESIQEARYYKTLFENMSLGPISTIDGHKQANPRGGLNGDRLGMSRSDAESNGLKTPSPIQSGFSLIGPGAKQGRETSDRLWDNRPPRGEVGKHGDYGFRTDVP